MEPWNSMRDRDTPDAIGTLGHCKRSGPQTVTAGDLDALRLGGFQREMDATVCSNTGGLRAPDIRFGRGYTRGCIAYTRGCFTSPDPCR